MKISIKHIKNTFNYGSSMMAINLLQYLESNLDKLEVYVDTSTEEDLNRLKLETGMKDIMKDNIGPGNNIFDRCVNKIKRIQINKKVSNSHAIIILGGDDISEYYGIEALERELKSLEEESYSKKVFLVGQTIGPFTEDRGNLAKKSLEKTKIYTRDDNCFEYLNELKFKNIKIGRDLAFLNLPNQYKAKDIISKYNLEQSKYITIVPSGLTKCYTINYDKYINQQIEIIYNLLKKGELLDCKLVLLPHVLLPKHVDDRLVIRDIIKYIDEKYKSRIIAIDDEMLPSEAREILANGIFTITGRMHAAVSTFYMRKPAISLSYSVKYAGVIGDGLDMNELVIESADDKLWEEGEISKLVDEKVNFVLDNYEDLICKIDKNVSETSKIVEEQLNDLIKELKK